MKKILFALIVLSLLFLAACEVPEVQDKQPDEQLVGGDRDSHGCIPSAGYLWCESKQKCLRAWEEDCPGQDLPDEVKE